MEIHLDPNIRDSTGKWLNSDAFRQEGIKFMQDGYYTKEQENTVPYLEYWREQLKRCEEGYTVGGHKITGHHYEYLNFSQIEVVDDSDPDAVVAVKETKNPDFWDGDYDYYWAIEIAKNGLLSKNALASTELEKQIAKELPHTEREELKQKILKRLNVRWIPHPDYLEGGNHIVVGKSRRKGYSYKNAAICVNTYNSVRNSLTIIGAFDKKYLYPEGTMGMASSYMDFINVNTAWTKAREYVDKQEHKRASYSKTVNGAKTEAGYKSDVLALTFKDNPDAARGKDAKYVLFEEAGKFPNLRAAFHATYPGLKAGRFITGQILVFGTGGDMESGTVDFADIFYHPIENFCMPFLNIWDEGAEGTYCGFFHPVYMNLEGYYDSQGNSDIEAAIKYEMSERDKLRKNATSSVSMQLRVQEFPLCPSEAFLTVSVNDFPIQELQARLNKVKANNLHIKVGQPVYLSYVEGKPAYSPDLSNVLEPIWEYKVKQKDLRGSVVMFEPPITGAPKGLYKIGFDPYRQASSNAVQPSLASIYVYKTFLNATSSNNIIVAQYIGRPYDPDDVNRIAEMLAIIYNTEIMHENEVTHVKTYFTKRRKLHLLASQPDNVISKAVNNSKVSRNYGIHMNDKIKDAGEKYIKAWLLTVRSYDSDGNAITNLDTICDPGLLEELILYNRKGNFDRVMALMMVMFQIEEDADEGDDSKEDEALKEEMEDMMTTQFKKNNNSYKQAA